MANFTLLPAYGRDYRNAYDARADFENGKDFIVSSFAASGTYINAPQIPDGSRVVIRFARATKLVTFIKGSTPPTRRARARGIPPVREYLVTYQVFRNDPDGEHARKRVTYRVLAPTVKLAELNANPLIAPENAHARLPGLHRLESVSAARKPIGQRAPVTVESVRVFVGVGERGADREGFRAETTFERNQRLTPEPAKGWVGEVVADNSGAWVRNALIFATEPEADGYVRHLAMRWTAVRETRTREVAETPTHEWDSESGLGPIGGEKRIPASRVSL